MIENFENKKHKNPQVLSDLKQLQLIIMLPFIQTNVKKKKKKMEQKITKD